MQYLIVAGFIAMDFITGLVKAFKQHNYTSSIMREGLFHKVGSIVCVAFGCLVDYGQGFLDIGIIVPIATPICTYIALMECGSIIENIAVINPRILPDSIRKYFQKLQ